MKTELDEKVKDVLPEDWHDRLLKSQKETIEFSFKREGDLPLTATRAGGVGYMPNHLPYPTNEDGKPLSLLAQLNFSELPCLEHFPNQGILAFYVDYYDDLIGLGIGEESSTDGYQVFYFESTDAESYTREEQLARFVPFEDEMAVVVVDQELRMIPQVTKQFLFTDCVEFEQAFGIAKHDIEAFDPYAEELDELAEFGTRLGGYPNFTQTDPRVYDEDRDVDVLLFQLDSDYDENGEWEIMWGDSGVANFFISLKDLREKKFENAWYNWDCM